jgi:hypothetical protein
MGRIFDSARGSSGERWNDEELLEFEAQCNDLLAEHGEVVLVAVARFFDQSARAKPA